MPEQVKHNNMLVIFGKSQDHSPPKNWIHNSLQCKDPQTLSEIQVEQTISTYWPAAKWGRQRAPFEKKQESVQHILHYMGVSSFLEKPWRSPRTTSTHPIFLEVDLESGMEQGCTL